MIDELERHNLLLQRVATKILATKGKDSLQAAYNAAVGELSRSGDITSIYELQALQRRIKAVLRDVMRLGSIESDMLDIANNELDFFSMLMSVKKPSLGEIKPMAASGMTGVFPDLLDSYDSQLADRYNAILAFGYANGDSIADIRKALKDATGGVASNTLEALVRTGVSHYASQAREQVAAHNADVLEYRVYWATMDNRVSTLCAGRHLKKWKVADDDYPLIPAHPNCRSVYLFLTKAQAGKLDDYRSALGGVDGEDAKAYFDKKKDSKYSYRGKKDKVAFKGEQIDANTPFDDWLRRQPRWFIDSTLGKTRAKLFIDGNLSIERFNDMTGRQITLAELRELEAEAFERANL